VTAAILAASQGEEGKADVFLRGRFFGSFGSLFNDERHCSPTCFSLSLATPTHVPPMLARGEKERTCSMASQTGREQLERRGREDEVSLVPFFFSFFFLDVEKFVLF